VQEFVTPARSAFFFGTGSNDKLAALNALITLTNSALNIDLAVAIEASDIAVSKAHFASLVTVAAGGVPKAIAGFATIPLMTLAFRATPSSITFHECLGRPHASQRSGEQKGIEKPAGDSFHRCFFSRIRLDYRTRRPLGFLTDLEFLSMLAPSL
jgi:hypothetical protein